MVIGWKLEVGVGLFSVVACAWLAMWLSFVLYGELLLKVSCATLP